VAASFAGLDLLATAVVVLDDDFVVRYVGACRKAAPLMSFLARAVGVPW